MESTETTTEEHSRKGLGVSVVQDGQKLRTQLDQENHMRGLDSWVLGRDRVFSRRYQALEEDQPKRFTRAEVK